YSTSSLQFLNGTEGLTDSTHCFDTTEATGTRSLRGSVCISLYRCGLMVIMLSASSASVVPSGGDFATRSIAMLPFEPGRFSTTTGWPRSSESLCPMTRAEISGAPPGGIGTMSLIGRKGYCAHEAAENRAPNARAVKPLGGGLMLSAHCPACHA